MGFWLTVLALVAILALAWRFLGAYMADVYTGKRGDELVRAVEALAEERR